jgi:hypothetical protein
MAQEYDLADYLGMTILTLTEKNDHNDGGYYREVTVDRLSPSGNAAKVITSYGPVWWPRKAVFELIEILEAPNLPDATDDQECSDMEDKEN